MVDKKVADQEVSTLDGKEHWDLLEPTSEDQAVMDALVADYLAASEQAS